MFASMNRIHRTTDHAVRIGARPARGGDQEVVELRSRPKQSRDRRSVGGGSMPLHATLRTSIATGAVVQIEDQNVLPLVQSVSDVLIQHPMANRRTPYPGE